MFTALAVKCQTGDSRGENVQVSLVHHSRVLDKTLGCAELPRWLQRWLPKCGWQTFILKTAFSGLWSNKSLQPAWFVAMLLPLRVLPIPSPWWPSYHCSCHFCHTHARQNPAASSCLFWRATLREINYQGFAPSCSALMMSQITRQPPRGCRTWTEEWGGWKQNCLSCCYEDWQVMMV